MKQIRFASRRNISISFLIACSLLVAAFLLRAQASELYMHLRQDGNVPKDAVIFIGDSITEGLCVAAVADKAVNYGISGDTTMGVLRRLPQYHSINRAKAVVLAIGINDMWRNPNSNPQILNNYELILKMIPKKIPVIFSAILPIDDRLEKDRPGGNARVAEVNKAAEKICAAHKNCHFFDSGSKLLAPDGQLKSEYHVGDGLHLGTKGYDVWIADMKKALEKI